MKPIYRDVFKLTKVSIPSIMKGPFEGLLLPSLDNVGPGVTILRCKVHDGQDTQSLLRAPLAVT